MKKFVLCLGFIFVACTNNKKSENYNFIKGLNAYEKNDKIEALKNYRLAYSNGMRETYLLRELAYLYTEFGDLEKAKKLYIEILNKEPENEEVIHNLLEILYKNNDIENIEKYSEKILNKNGLLYLESQFNLAYLKNNYKLAREVLEDIVLIKRENILNKNYDRNFLTQIKNIYTNEENNKLLKILDVLYSNNKDNRDFIKYYASVLVEEKLYDKAEEILMKGIVNNSNTNDLLIDLAKVYSLNNKEEKSKIVLKILEKNK